MFDIRGVRSIYYVLYVRHTWCLLSNLIIYVVDRKRVGKVCHSCFIIFCTENEVYAEKRIRDTYAHILINVNITIGKVTFTFDIQCLLTNDHHIKMH